MSISGYTVCLGTRSSEEHVRCVTLSDGKRVFAPLADFRWFYHGDTMIIVSSDMGTVTLPREKTQYTAHQCWPTLPEKDVIHPPKEQFYQFLQRLEK